MSNGAKAAKDEVFSGQTGYFNPPGSDPKVLVHEDDIAQQGDATGSASMKPLGAMGKHLTRETWERLSPDARAQMTRRSELARVRQELLAEQAADEKILADLRAGAPGAEAGIVATGDSGLASSTETDGTSTEKEFDDSPRSWDEKKKDAIVEQIATDEITLADVRAAQHRLNVILNEKSPGNEELQEIKKAQERLVGQEAELTQKVADLKIQSLQKDHTTRDVLRKSQKAGEQIIRDELSSIDQKMLDHEIDPRRAFKSTWQVVGAAVAAAAGAFAQGLHSRNIPNTALLLIERAINRDIEAQKADLKKLGQVRQMKQNVLAHLIEQNQDEARSLAEAQIVARDTAILKLDKLAAETKSLQAKQGIAYVRRELEIQKAQQTHALRIQAAESELATYLQVLGLQNRGGSRAGTATSVDPVELSRKFQLFENVIKGLDVGTGIFNVSTATDGQITEYINMVPVWGGHLASDYTSLDPEGAKLYQNYAAYGLLVVTELAKSYQGKHLSDRDMKSYLAVLPDIGSIHNEETRKLAIDRMRDLRHFFLNPKFTQGSAQSRSSMILNYALENGGQSAEFYLNDKADFDDPQKQRYLEAFRAEKAARDR